MTFNRHLDTARLSDVSLCGPTTKVYYVLLTWKGTSFDKKTNAFSDILICCNDSKLSELDRLAAQFELAALEMRSLWPCSHIWTPFFS
jgi:hypothetical protein